MTDGTSNTIMVGEVLPFRAADSNFWHLNGATGRHDRPAGLELQHRSPPAPELLSQPVAARCRWLPLLRRRQGLREPCTRAGPTSCSPTARSTSSRRASHAHVLRAWAAATAARLSARRRLLIKIASLSRLGRNQLRDRGESLDRYPCREGRLGPTSQRRTAFPGSRLVSRRKLIHDTLKIIRIQHSCPDPRLRAGEFS